MSKQNSSKSFVWSFANQFFSKAVSFFIQIFLARLLTPEDFGLIAMSLVFINIFNALSDSGMSSSLIRTKKPNHEDYNTVFLTNLTISIILYTALYFSAPSIGDFYNDNSLIQVIRLLGIVIIIQSFSSIQRTKLTKEMAFKNLTYIELPPLIIGGAVGLYLAMNNFGVWAIVFMHISLKVTEVFLFWIVSNWKPKIIINLQKLKSHFDYGYKMTLTTLINQLFRESYNILIGKYISISALGLYNRASSLQSTPTTLVARSINRVTFPLFANYQDDNSKLKEYYRKATALVLFIMGPFSIICFFLSNKLIPFILGDQWIEAAPIFQVLVFLSVILPIITFNLNIVKAKGLSGLVLKINTWLKGLSIIFIFLLIHKGVMWLVYLQIITSVLELIVNAHYSGRLINYPIISQLKDIITLYLLSIIPGILTFLCLCNFSVQGNFIFIIIFIVIFTGFYILLLELVRNKFYVEGKKLIIQFYKKILK